MARRPVQARVGAAPDQKRWPWWSILSAPNQNVTADLELARVKVAIMAGRRLRGHDRTILRTCQEMLAKCTASHRRIFFKNRIFVQQSLFVIFQSLLLIGPREALRASWMTIKQRLDTSKASESAQFDPYARAAIDTFFGNDAQRKTAPDEKTVREMMREIRAHLDDKAIGEVWNGIALQQKTYLAVAFALVSLGIFLWALACESGYCLVVVMQSTPQGTVKQHGLIATICAGILGGSLSAIARPRSASDAGSLPLVRFTFIRPILGGIAGLFLYLVATNSQAVTFTYPYLYAAAIAFGFSEYALTDALSATADRVSAQVNKAIGQSGGDKKTEGPAQKPDEQPKPKPARKARQARRVTARKAALPRS